MIRPVTKSDAAQLVNIYGYYVENTAITAELTVPSVAEFEQRIEKTTQKYPYICAEENGKILGYAYAGVFRSRAGFNHTVELSIYIDKSARKKGIGRLLYQHLIPQLKKMGIINLYASITVPDDQDDEYLDHNSENFHKHLGFKTIGYFRSSIHKFNRWYGMIFMEKIIGEYN